jgi:dihydrolipoamide dehydrogenase
MTPKEYDVVIIGAGPGGYVAAIRAAQLGLKTCLVEKEHIGGVCLNWGCIPSKSLIHQATTLCEAKSLAHIGAIQDFSQIDYSKVQDSSRDAVNTLSGGVSHLLKKNKVEVISETGKLAGAGKVELSTGQVLYGRNMILATGSRPMSVPGFGFDEQRVLSSTGILKMRTLPKKLVVLGGGAIGCEFSYIMNAFGVEVVLVEMDDHLLPTEDHEVTAVLEKSFLANGINVKTGTRATALTKEDSKLKVHLESSTGQAEVVPAEAVLVVFGRTPNTEQLGLETVGIEADSHGYINTGPFCQTTAANIFAIGDITLTPALAHVASKEGELVAEHIAGHVSRDNSVDPMAVPSAIYSEPQVAGFGLREQEAIARGIRFRKYSFPIGSVGKAVATHKTDGLIKTLVDSQTGEILGGHIVGHNATELLHLILLARQGELLAEDIGTMIHAHPTFSEAVMEGMRGIYGKPIHA